MHVIKTNSVSKECKYERVHGDTPEFSDKLL